MFFINPLTHLILIISFTSSLAAPGSNWIQGNHANLNPRQSSPTQMKSTGVKTFKMNSSNQINQLDQEAREEAEERKPSLNTIANAIKEVYYHDKYASQRNDPNLLLKMIGQAIGSNSKSADPELIAKAILAAFEAYNQAQPSSSNAPSTKKNDSITDMSPSLNTIAHALHEVWEKQIMSTGNSKLENMQLIPVMCQAIATSSTSGDPTTVVKAINSTYAKSAA